MTVEDNQSQAFVEKVLALLEERFPWLGKEDDEVGRSSSVPHRGALWGAGQMPRNKSVTSWAPELLSKWKDSAVSLS
jgi:hypothetical protein